ncbi:MAG: tetratricopeptide repeat protein, partial [Terrimicrobiaceae bacterium]|nr:tetratricopeptide repeat protein [Terrimicrobiaceae bacterium]
PQLLDAAFYFEFGAAAERAGSFDLAAELLERSIRMDPGNAAKARNYLGYMWADQNTNLEEAEKLIRQALEAEPENGAYLDSLGWVLYRKGRFEEALALLLQAAEKIEAPDPVVYDHIGDASQALGKKEEALLYWRKALALDPGNSSIAAKIEAATGQAAAQHGQDNR